MKILAHSDASHLTADNKARGIAGRITYLSNKSETKVSPIGWKSKTIAQVCRSAKAAETRALDLCGDDSIFMARVIHELYTGKKGLSRDKQMMITVKCDNRGLLENIE